MRYQYLLIDNDNTLMDFSAAEAKALVDVLAAHGLPTDEHTIHTYHEINDALWKRLERGEVTREQILIGRFAQLFSVLGIVTASIPVNYGMVAFCGHFDCIGPGKIQFIASCFSDSSHGICTERGQAR